MFSERLNRRFFISGLSYFCRIKPLRPQSFSFWLTSHNLPENRIPTLFFFQLTGHTKKLWLIVKADNATPPSPIENERSKIQDKSSKYDHIFKLSPFYYFSPHMYYARKIIHSTGSFFFPFFLQTKIANSFHSQINDSSRHRTTRFSSSRFGIRVTIVPNIFTIYP